LRGESAQLPPATIIKKIHPSIRSTYIHTYIRVQRERSNEKGNPKTKIKMPPVCPFCPRIPTKKIQGGEKTPRVEENWTLSSDEGEAGGTQADYFDMSSSADLQIQHLRFVMCFFLLGFFFLFREVVRWFLRCLPFVHLTKDFFHIWIAGILSMGKRERDLLKD
jgi:hypothetical protein